MPFSLDRANFPVVKLDELGLETTLFPITKVQFEAFLSDPAFKGSSLYGDAWYDQLLALNARVCPAAFSANNRERLFLTGIFPDEILPFARWLGDFELPTIEEWRQVDEALRHRKAEISDILDSPDADARSILRRLYRQIEPRNLAELGLTLQGVIEWVRDGTHYFGLGQPRPQFHPNVYNPRLRLAERFSSSGAERHRAYGARLVRRPRFAAAQDTDE